jgi:Xaa-Pro aminopeptidase
MGKNQQAGFVGHGVGLVINELPVLAPKMKDVLEAGMVLAIEPKFVVEGVGAVGVENTFVVGKEHGEKISLLEEEIIDLTNL